MQQGLEGCSALACKDRRSANSTVGLKDTMVNANEQTNFSLTFAHIVCLPTLALVQLFWVLRRRCWKDFSIKRRNFFEQQNVPLS